MSLTEPELAPVTLRLEVEELDGVEKIRFAFRRFLFDVLEGGIKRIDSRLQRCHRNVVRAVKVFDVFDDFNLYRKRGNQY